jgi:hypothetical protein
MATPIRVTPSLVGSVAALAFYLESDEQGEQGFLNTQGFMLAWIGMKAVRVSANGGNSV